MARFRALKQDIGTRLQAPDWEALLEDAAKTCGCEPCQAVGPLFSMLLAPGETRWRAVSVLGRVIARMADERMEDARVIMRRLMWNLNEESGNVAWGAPEAMGETLARHAGLAEEFGDILVSYIHDTGTDDIYLDHAPLRRGAVWGVGRLAQARPERVRRRAVPLLLEELRGDDGPIRGLAAWALGVLAAPEASMALGKLVTDPTRLELFRDGVLQDTTVGEQAREALQRIKAASDGGT